MAKTFELQGGEKLKRTLEKIWKATPKEAAQALYEEAQIEKKESMERTPVRFGILKASHKVERPVLSWSGIEVKIKVGGPAINYAIPVHENTEAFHKVGQAKFLESTLLESRPYMARRIAKRIDLRRITKRRLGFIK